MHVRMLADGVPGPSFDAPVLGTHLNNVVVGAPAVIDGDQDDDQKTWELV